MGLKDLLESKESHGTPQGLLTPTLLRRPSSLRSPTKGPPKRYEEQLDPAVTINRLLARNCLYSAGRVFGQGEGTV